LSFCTSFAADVRVLEMIRPDQQVVAADQMHHAQEDRAGHTAGQAANLPRLQIDHHGVAKTLHHERDPRIVRRNVRALAKVREHLDVRRKMIERVSGLALGSRGIAESQGTRDYQRCCDANRFHNWQSYQTNVEQELG
jgi:hypothetical protein